MDSDGLECSICCEIMTKAVTLHPCGHSFCEKCVQEWRKQSKGCALCKVNCEGIFPNIMLRQIISSFLEKSKLGAPTTPSFKFCDDCSKSKLYFAEISISDCFVPCDFCIGRN